MDFVATERFRIHLAELLDRARVAGEATVITRHNRPAAVLAPIVAHYLLVDDPTGAVAVGPFPDVDAARDWEDTHDQQLGTVRGVVRTALPEMYVTSADKDEKEEK